MLDDDEDDMIKVIGRFVPFTQLPFEIWENDRLVAAFAFEEDYKEYMGDMLVEVNENRKPH